jgi:hypothetical protein
MRITKRQLRQIIKEETLAKYKHRRNLPPFPGALEDQMMDMLEEYITRLAESGEEGAVEVETLLTQLVSRAIDIATRDGVIK